jgi:acetyltransferase-like isoleucine patch superfamily enzyme
MGVNIGWACYIGKPLYWHGIRRIFLGSKVRIYPNSRFETHGRSGVIKIGNNTAIGQDCHITSAGVLEIGKNCLITKNVTITNINHDFNDISVPMPEQPLIFNRTSIGNNCFIGANAVISAGTILEDNCIVGANSVLIGYYPRGSVIVGSPAKVIKSYSYELKKWFAVNKEL